MITTRECDNVACRNVGSFSDAFLTRLILQYPIGYNNRGLSDVSERTTVNLRNHAKNITFQMTQPWRVYWIQRQDVGIAAIGAYYVRYTI